MLEVCVVLWFCYRGCDGHDCLCHGPRPSLEHKREVDGQSKLVVKVTKINKTETNANFRANSKSRKKVKLIANIATDVHIKQCSNMFKINEQSTSSKSTQRQFKEKLAEMQITKSAKLSGTIQPIQDINMFEPQFKTITVPTKNSFGILSDSENSENEDKIPEQKTTQK